jgi:hypothetical protein
MTALSRQNPPALKRWLDHVIGGLCDRHRVVLGKRAEWRSPGQADADGGTHHIPVGDRIAVQPTVPRTLPASTKAEALRPYSFGTPRIALCSSAVVAQYMLPPTLSMVVPDVRSRGPKPLVAKPRTSSGRLRNCSSTAPFVIFRNVIPRIEAVALDRRKFAACRTRTLSSRHISPSLTLQRVNSAC